LGRGRGSHRADMGLGPGTVARRTIAGGAGPHAATGGCGRRGPLSVRADGALVPATLPARSDSRGPDPRTVVEPVVLGPDDQGDGGRRDPPRPVSVPDLRLFDGRSAGLFGHAAASRSG